jgi:HD-GYP domain-containing protein (c-di-GMP phosphodiesterase class II)
MKALDLSKTIVAVAAERLRTGHYVSRLDRPWTDTPFLFQGFVIESDEQLATLRQLCKVVYVEVSRAEADELGRPTHADKPGGERKPPDRPDLLTELTIDPGAFVAETPVRDPTPFTTELTLAAATFGDAQRVVGNIFDNLRRGGSLDVPNLQTVVGSMVDSVFRNRDAMGWLARMKSADDYLYNHSLAASVWALTFGRHLGLDRDTLSAIGTGAMLLDVGKTRLPPELLKKPGKPSAEEWQLIRQHVGQGLELLAGTPGLDQRALTMVATHHERFDGSGYPDTLKGDDIPLLGRIAGIVDSYDAMIADRCYAQPRSAYEAVRELKQLGGTAFSGQMVELFIQAVGVFPTGTLVELNTGEVGVVIGQNRFRRLRPEVMLILDTHKKVRSEFTTVDLLTCKENSKSKEPELWIKRGLERGAFGIDPAEYFL